MSSENQTNSGYKGDMQGLFRRFFFLGFVVFAVVVAAYVLHFWTYPFALSNNVADWAAFGGYVGGTLGAFFAFLAFIGILLNAAIQRRATDDLRDRAKKEDLQIQDRLFLDEYRKGYDAAFEILQSATNGNPDLRAKWVAAARIIEVARQLSQRIEGPAYREILMLDLPNQSARFHTFVELPATYFYGVGVNELNNIPADNHLRVAAELSIKRPSGSTEDRSIPELAIYAVWNAIKYPTEYRDVLSERFSDAPTTSLPRGLQDYLASTRERNSIGGTPVSSEQ